jgi:release factor glutamine methyltransferase
VIARGSERVPDAAVALFEAAIEQRARRRPLQHLTGHQAFWKHDFVVTPDVLIPRPETELLVETALELIQDRPSPLVVDVGTGSGCIALSLAAERPDARVHAVDLSSPALAVARANAERMSLRSRVVFHRGDLLEPVASLAGAVDLVVSNPPYVTAEEWAGLEPEVRDHEPRVALVPGDGVPALYRRLFASAAGLLRIGGACVVEVGQGQADALAALARDAGLEIIEIRPDLQRIPRAVVALRPLDRNGRPHL